MAYRVISGMPRRPRYARIAITLPQEDLAAADHLAERLQRSRSWVVAEAIRRYAGSGLGASRLAQLTADLRLSPEARVRAAESTARVAALRQRPRRDRLVAFDRYEDWLDWKRRDEAVG